MDDDFTFGASVWAADESEATSTSSFQLDPPPVTTNFDDMSAFDDFDDFGPPGETTTGSDIKEDDDFGDFGDFGEADAGPSAFVDATDFDNTMPIAGPSSQIWRPLPLDPFPSRPSLERELNETLAPIWNNENISDFATEEGIREVEGVAQILYTPSRCVA